MRHVYHLFVGGALALLGFALPARASEPPRIFVQHGQPLGLNRELLLGEVASGGDCLVVRSAQPGSDSRFGGHYISIGILADAILAPGNYHLTAKLGLKCTSGETTPVVLRIKIGRQWHELAFAEGAVTLRGILLDAVRYEQIELDYAVPVRLDGQPFTLEFVYQDGVLRVLVEGHQLLEQWIEPTGGDVALCVERNQLLRVASSTDDIEAELRIFNWQAAAEFQPPSAERRRWDAQTGATWKLMQRVGSAYAYVEDDPQVPNVLLIGDSISIYYTDPVRRLLRGRADVYRTPMGPGKAETLFRSLDEFLRERQWDVIHFNSGLHDFARKEGDPQEVAQYRRNLELILAKLQATGARVIWASTTPVPATVPAQISSDAVAKIYNASAQALMEEQGVTTNDLYTAILPHHDQYWLAPNNIHFNRAGSAFLGRRVANAVLAELTRQR